jgi:hypothetical protein
MITETRQSRTRLLQYEHHQRRHHHHPRRRHHTLDNATLDQFNFICVPLHPNEVNLFFRNLFGFSFLFFNLSIKPIVVFFTLTNTHKLFLS